MKNKLITIIIAMLLLVSVVYAPNNNENNPQRSEDAPGQELRTTGVELSFAPFDLSSVSPELTSVFSYKLMFIDTPARIGDLRVKKILLSNQGAYTADEEESYARIDLADLNQDGNFMVHIANIPFLLYKSEDADGQGNPGYVLVDSRAQEANSPDSIDYQDARYFALVLYNHDNNQGSYAFSDLNGLREKQFLARDGSIDFRITKERRETPPRELARVTVDNVVLETPASGCKDEDLGSNNQYQASFAHDGQHVLNDFCAYGNNKEILHEAKCNVENQVDVEEIECSNGCKDGACKRQDTSVPTQTEFCIDTDQIEQKPLSELTAEELGIALSSKGATIGFFISKESKYALWEDSCSSDTKLIEYYCKRNKVGFIQVNCACSEGKCSSSQSCIDSDGGENQKAKGGVFGIKSDNTYSKLEDVCIDNTQLREYACDNTFESKDLVINCEFGCSEGRCLKESEQPVVAPIEETVVTGVVEEPVVVQPTVCNDDESVTITDKASYITALRNVNARLAEYKNILDQAESIHGQPTPAQLKAINAVCAVSSQCSSNYCNPTTKRCAVKPAALKANGAQCTAASASQCRSKVCTKISGQNGICGKKTGDSCQAAAKSYCLSNICSNSRCGLSQINGLCSKSADCSTGNCNVNTHKCAARQAAGGAANIVNFGVTNPRIPRL